MAINPYLLGRRSRRPWSPGSGTSPFQQDNNPMSPYYKPAGGFGEGPGHDDSGYGLDRPVFWGERQKKKKPQPHIPEYAQSPIDTFLGSMY